jgi:SAM-dependent methyltransferase
MERREGLTGSGPGTITPDGCAVELYARLPAMGEPEIVHAAVPAGASVIEFGCGTGRIAGPLARLGHRVVGVDESAEMLERCRAGGAGVETVRSSIEELDLDERFDAVLLASHLVNSPGPMRTTFLQVAHRHLAPGGTVVVQRFRPGWVAAATDSEHDDGTMRSTLTVLGRPGPDEVHARVSYAIGDSVWEQEFTTRELDDDALPEALAAAGLRLDRMLTADGEWFTAVAEGE